MNHAFKIAAFSPKAYTFNAPIGEWTAQLDYKSWGKSTNLFLYFTDIETGLKYRLSVFSRNRYCPYENKLNFKHEPIDQIYYLRTGKNKKGFPTLLRAVLV